MSNLTLYIVDANQSPALMTSGSGVQALVAQLPSVAECASVHVLLLGCDQIQLINWHRVLFQYGIAPSHCHALLPDSAEMLHSIDPALLGQVQKHMVDALAPARIIDVASAAVIKPESAEEAETGPLPTLAFISPLPPQATGIASYSAELLPYLAEHFTITLVVDQPEVDPELSTFECIDPLTFSRRAEEFAYTLYQVGNSLYHAYQFGLLRRHPGTVVLHDYFLFDAIWWLEESGLRTNAVRERLYADHGYPALVDHARAIDGGRGAEQYPVSGLVTQYAGGIIYHSEHARTLARRWGQGEQSPTYHIPHLRNLPTCIKCARARQTLNISKDTLVIASFGGINPKKLTHVLVEAFFNAAPENAQLVLVGAQHGGEYGQLLTHTIKRHPKGQRVTVTGYASRDTYTAWLHAADIAVQLRTQSRGETSGAVFDAMAHSIAVIANAHGSNAELPEHSVYLLPDHGEPAALIEALSQALIALSRDAARRERLACAGRDHVASTLAPARIAAQYRDAIIDAPRRSPRYRYERYLDQLATNPALRQAARTPDKAKRLTYVLSEAETTPTEELPRLLIDVSTLAWEDLKTGIERVTRRVSDHLLRHPPNGWRVELIRWGGDDFYLARGFACDQLGLDASPGPDVPVEARPGDYYASLEWAPPLLKQAGHVMQRMRANGVRFYFTVHDLLPLSLPECFPAHIPATMREWFSAISELADGIMCVSQHVAHTVETELTAPHREGQHRPWVKHFHLGADFQHRETPSPLLTKAERQQLAPLEQRDGPVLLMVGTIEPRKGHQQVLDALERSWADGASFNLVVVGKQGWDVEALIARLKRHPERQKRLFWFTNASDALLNTLYQRSNALVAASYGEGFGLPLIEAAHHGIAILARDIPVFREVAGEYADYFKADTPDALATALKQWEKRWQGGRTVSSNGMPFLSWYQSAEQWATTILNDQPSTTTKEPV
ncbi:glycosyltransferase [Halomonas vilamensis]|uniref:Glycosyltransferase n=1 Tax=Vreelandella vilamensis TaxID=531309 RepID=A0ABU1H431_9GAMM|nr:glycosyltransferase [Halomonas vilamensis]MDR5899062.1 glycosyltransferase [Halomonas vilamensis]